MVDAIFRAVKSDPRGLWRHTGSYIAALLRGPTPPSLDRTTVLLSRYLPSGFWNKSVISKWVAVVSTIPYSEEVGRSVVDTMLQIASIDDLRPHIPIGVWAWLKKEPSLPPVCLGRSRGAERNVIRHVRGLGDLDLLKSYFLLVWSEWDTLSESGLEEMKDSIAEDLGGIWMQHHRWDLTRRLCFVFGALCNRIVHVRSREGDRWVYPPGIKMRISQNHALRRILGELDRKAMKDLARMSRLIGSDKHTNPCELVQDPI